MQGFVAVLYLATCWLIKIFKFVEFRVLHFLLPLYQNELIRKLESVGAIFHLPGESKEISKSKEAKVLKNCEGKYDSVLHFQVKDVTFFTRLATYGVLGAGESFMDGLWDPYNDNWEDVTKLITRLFEGNVFDLYYYYHPFNIFFEWLETSAFNLQTRERAFEVGKVHYDLGNDLYEAMLDPWMQYTCAYWKDATTLEDAQLAKLKLIGEKLDLKPGMRVLDVGCGWGTLCKYLAENYQVECVGVTIGKEGAAYGQRVCAGLPVDIRVQDYRDLNEKFDRIVSIGCLEHVGHWNYTEYFKTCRKCLKDDGLFLLHCIGRNHYNFPRNSIPWANKYIFPNGSLPSPCDIANYTKGLFIIEDWHNFGPDYAKTLVCWKENFEQAWPRLEDTYGGTKFFRMWIFYLVGSIAFFRSRRLQLWQVVLTKDGLKREYRAAR